MSVSEDDLNFDRPRRRKRRGWLRKLLWAVAIFLVLAVAGFLVADSIFNVRSNVVYLANRNSEEPLLVKVRGKGKSGERSGWVSVYDAGGPELESSLRTVYSGEGVLFQQLRIRRNATNMFQWFVGILFDSEVNVFTFRPEAFKFRTSFRDDFEPTTARERVSEDGVAFALNANFFGPDGKPLGWVVSGGEMLSAQYRNWTGFFFVKNGRPYFGPRSLLDDTEGEVSEAAQGYPSLITDHTVFNYAGSNKFYDGKKITYRSLAGVRQNGEVVFILSGDGGVMNVGEIAEIARNLRIQHATLWDGGRALQYCFRVDGFEFGFHSFNNEVEFEREDLAPVRSPVYISAQNRKSSG